VGRTHSPKGQVVFKKTEKLKAVDEALPAGASLETIAAKFKELYPGDWDRIVGRYKKHELMTKPGKTHPMPEPETYLLNMVKTYKAAAARPKK
jgi:hypothetical protein